MAFGFGLGFYRMPGLGSWDMSLELGSWDVGLGLGRMEYEFGIGWDREVFHF